MKTRFKFFTLLFIAAMLTISCNKDSLDDAVLAPNIEGAQAADGTNGQDGVNGIDGAPGPQGEQGEKGSQGEQGIQGETGPQGPAGNNGAPGPAGPAGSIGETGATGATGATGPAGPAGVNGTNGQNGNANIIASDWLEPKESSFNVNNPKSKVLKFPDYSRSSNTNEDVVLVYYDNDIEIRLLPKHTFNNSTGSLSKSIESHINHASGALYITFRKYNSDLTTREYLWNASKPIYSRGVRFRYVIIPNGTSGKNNGIDFKKMSYENVMDHFGLEH